MRLHHSGAQRFIRAIAIQIDELAQRGPIGAFEPILKERLGNLFAQQLSFGSIQHAETRVQARGMEVLTDQPGAERMNGADMRG